MDQIPFIYNFNDLQNLNDLNTTDFSKHHQIIGNILEGWKRLLKSELLRNKELIRENKYRHNCIET